MDGILRYVVTHASESHVVRDGSGSNACSSICAKISFLRRKPRERGDQYGQTSRFGARNQGPGSHRLAGAVYPGEGGVPG